MARVTSLFVKATAVLSLAGLVSAAPNVTVVPLPSGCAGYPNYDNATGIAGPLRLLVDSTGREQDGFKFIPKYAIAVGGGSWGFMVIPTIENKTADAGEIIFRCGNDTLQAQLDMGFAGTRWQPLIAAGTPGEAVFGFNLPDLPDPNYHLETWYVRLCRSREPHSHVIEGVTQPGVFLGAVNVTTWGFNYQNFTETGEYYFSRLLGPNSQNRATGKPLNPGEFAGYIKVESIDA
ncbi:hypothetical protein F5Y13DRAFT_184442 [Hypoxylon sp. FL1857]|nr:hypothetical protein F5Y13DRAFT_184442 [Hypoxylon sp. FL1857]